MRERRVDSEGTPCQPPKNNFCYAKKRGNPTHGLSYEITPQDPVAVAGEIGVALSCGTDRRGEHRCQKTGDEGEDCRICPQGFSPITKALSPIREARALMSAIASSACSPGYGAQILATSMSS
jgi:hypothetical protein